MILRTGRYRAYTFMELMFAVLILAVLAGIGFPGLKKNYQRMVFNSKIREIRNFCDLLYMRAINNRAALRVEADNEKHTLSAYRHTSDDVPGMHKEEEVLLSFDIPDQIEIECEENENILVPQFTDMEFRLNIKDTRSGKDALLVKDASRIMICMDGDCG